MASRRVIDDVCCCRHNSDNCVTYLRMKQQAFPLVRYPRIFTVIYREACLWRECAPDNMRGAVVLFVVFRTFSVESFESRREPEII